MIYGRNMRNEILQENDSVIEKADVMIQQYTIALKLQKNTTPDDIISDKENEYEKEYKQTRITYPKNGAKCRFWGIVNNNSSRKWPARDKYCEN